jgi:DNA modification methylase
VGNLRLEWIDPKTLTPNPANWRRHPKAQKDALEAVIGEVGWAGALLYNETTGRLIDGHLRQEISHDGPVPVLVGKWTEAQERLILATLDPIAALAEAESDALDALLKTVETESEAVKALLERLAQDEGLSLGEPVADPGAQVDKAAELQEKWRVETGELWEIGAHRLVCGDCTDGAVVERVMGGEKASFCFTDPPYGVKYTGGTKKWAMLENDDEVNMYAASLPLIDRFTEDKATLYLAFADANARSVYNSLADNGFIQRALIIWNKNLAQFGAMGSQYKQKHEPIAYCFKKGEAPYWFGPSNEVTVWDIDRAMANEFHPTQKPVELVVRAMRNSAPPASIVLDPFLGSGTTAVACEQLHRRCFGIEIHPSYCAVTLERLSQMGLEPRRVE